MPPFLLVPAALFVIPVIFGSSPLFLIGAIPFAWLAYRMLRIGVFADDEGVTVRDVVRRTKRVPWDAIDRFDLMGKRGYDVGVMYLKDGTSITPTALQGPWGKGKAVPRALAGLNEELARHRTAAPSTSHSTTAPVESANQLTLPTNERDAARTEHPERRKPPG